MSDFPSTLEAPGVEPCIDHSEVLGTVIYLSVLESLRLSVLENRCVRTASISYFSQILRQMNGSIRILTNAQQEH